MVLSRMGPRLNATSFPSYPPTFHFIAVSCVSQSECGICYSLNTFNYFKNKRKGSMCLVENQRKGQRNGRGPNLGVGFREVSTER